MSALDRSVRWLCAAALWLPIVVIALLLARLASLASPSSPALGEAVGASLALTGLTGLLALPPAIGAAIYLEEYGVSSRFGALVEFNISQLASVPPVVYGLLGVELFLRMLELRAGMLVSALTLAVVVLPMLTDGARTALREVPSSQREAGLALGASSLAILRHVVLPAALPNMIAATLRSLARALGEAAPLLLLGLLAASETSVLPLRIYALILADDPQRAATAASILVALCLILSLAAALIQRPRPELAAPWRLRR